MTTPIITVENLSKAYRIGLKDEVPDSLVGALQGLVSAPLRNWRRLRRLDTFRQNGDTEDTIWALKDVSFEVQEGEVLGIIGRNGAGKSTLLKILSRITEPTTGRAILRGRVSSLLEVGTGFHPELTGRENIYMNGTILGMTKREIDRKFDEIVDFSGVEKFLDTPIKRYSSGMKVRLAFSVAAHLEPEILIIDEVLAVGDAEFQKKCLGKMQLVAETGRTVLFVSHNMAAVEALCHRGMHIEQGKILTSGPIGDVVADYRRYAMGGCETASHEFHDTRYIRRLDILDAKSQPANIVPVGQDVRLRITIDPEQPVAYPRIVVGINDILGHRLLTVQSPANGGVLKRLDGRTVVECVVHEFPLTPGTYILSLNLWKSRQRLERILDCATLMVVDAPLFDEGRGCGSGLCIAKTSWTQPMPPAGASSQHVGDLRIATEPKRRHKA
jgi:lipopolysaccharide transport system ATP-binding protein